MKQLEFDFSSVEGEGPVRSGRHTGQKIDLEDLRELIKSEPSPA